MKKLLKIIPAIILSVFLLSQFCVAFANEKTVTGIRLEIDAQKRFVTLGSQPDLSGAKINITYYDGSKSTLKFDKKYLVEWQKNTLGRCYAKFNVDGNRFTDYFIVYDEQKNALDFSDVTRKYWGFKQIQHCYSAGFFVGVSKTEFGVSDNMTRAQFCQMIYQIFKNDDEIFTRHKQASFADVGADAWYFKAVTACAESEIVSGMGDGTFCPDNPIKREDVAVIMMRILLGPTGADTVDIEAMLADARDKKGIAANDFESTSDYAKKYMVSALGVIYYGDKAGNLNPQNNITRTECAAMINTLFFDGFIDPAPKRVVYLSPESGGNQYAIYNKNDPVKSQYTEHIQMTLVAKKVKEILEKQGIEVHIATKEISIRDENNNRAMEAASFNADCYVALHTNAAGSPSQSGKVQGTTCYYNGNNKGSKELSQFIYDKVAALTPTKDLGNHDDMKTLRPFAEIRLPTMANVLLEIEFHDYAPFATWIVNNIDNIAIAVADGICDYLDTLD